MTLFSQLKKSLIDRFEVIPFILAQDIRYTYWHSDMAEDSSCRDKLR